jgi:hypothetical protein
MHFLQCLQKQKKPVTDFIKKKSTEYDNHFELTIKQKINERYRLYDINRIFSETKIDDDHNTFSETKIDDEHKTFFIYFTGFIAYFHSRRQECLTLNLTHEEYDNFVSPLLNCFDRYMEIIDRSSTTATVLSDNAMCLRPPPDIVKSAERAAVSTALEYHLR